MASANVLDAYAATVGQVRVAATQLHGNQPGNPAKLAQVVIRLAGSENPPLHLPIGKDAVDNFRNSAARAEKDVAAWEDVSRSTDHVKAAVASN